VRAENWKRFPIVEFGESCRLFNGIVAKRGLIPLMFPLSGSLRIPSSMQKVM
jgi:hypothetical protein